LRDPVERSAAQARFARRRAGAGVSDADILIEAIFENLEAKRALYAQANRASAPPRSSPAHSSIRWNCWPRSPGSRAARRASFFQPRAQMPLIEVIHSAQTKPEPLAAAMAFARRIDKLPLPCRSGPGFLVNRVLFPYLHEALYAAGEGVPLGVIDRAAVDFGMPMGPIELSDVVGLDVIVHVGEIITRELGREMPPYTQRLRDLVAARKLGRKSGAARRGGRTGLPSCQR